MSILLAIGGSTNRHCRHPGERRDPFFFDGFHMDSGLRRNDGGFFFRDPDGCP
jgi:hypothetical protein